MRTLTLSNKDESFVFSKQANIDKILALWLKLTNAYDIKEKIRELLLIGVGLKQIIGTNLIRLVRVKSFIIVSGDETISVVESQPTILLSKSDIELLNSNKELIIEPISEAEKFVLHPFQHKIVLPFSKNDCLEKAIIIKSAKTNSEIVELWQLNKHSLLKSKFHQDGLGLKNEKWHLFIKHIFPSKKDYELICSNRLILNILNQI